MSHPRHTHRLAGGTRSALTLGSLFSGIGGLELGFERTGGFETRWQVENDPYATRVLERHWPNVRRYGDITKLQASELERVDVIVGGFPCQDISIAMRADHSRSGLDGARSGLWSEYIRIVRALRPRYVVVENVPALLYTGFERVLGDLASLGYDAEWGILSACTFGAPHTRERVFIVAHSNSFRWAAGAKEPRALREMFTNERARDNRERPSEAQAWAESDTARFCRVADGIPRRMDGYKHRIKAIGNAVVPQVAQYVAECVLEHARATGVTA